MAKKVCPYADFNECPHVQQAKMKTKKKSEIIKRTPYIVTIDRSEHCGKCNKKIPKGVKFVKWIVKKQVGEHVNDLETVGEDFVCASCVGVEKL